MKEEPRWFAVERETHPSRSRCFVVIDRVTGWKADGWWKTRRGAENAAKKLNEKEA